MSTNIGIPTRSLNKMRLSAAGDMPDHDSDGISDLPYDVLAAISTKGRRLLVDLGPLETPAEFAEAMRAAFGHLWAAIMRQDASRARDALLVMGSLGIHAGVVLAPTGPAPHPAGHEFDVLDVDRADEPSIDLPSVTHNGPEVTG